LKPGEKWYDAKTASLHALLARVFGSDTALAARTVRLGFRLLEWGPGSKPPTESARVVNSIGQQDETNLVAVSGLAVPRFVHRDFEVVSDRPATLTFDQRGRPNSATGPFCEWSDGSALFAIHGVAMPAGFLQDPPSFGPSEIDAERNVEVRRVMLERYRMSRYMRQTAAQVLDRSDRFGTLYRRDLPGEEPLVMVEVVNSTPEPDGSSRRYWLRVPPDVRTARAAVAWSFGLEENAYAPTIET
jgi:hypothetical protein